MIFEQVQSLRESANGVNTKLGNTRVRALKATPNVASKQVIGKDGFRSPLMPRRIGYIRVSTRAQTTDRQTKALEAECDELRIEQVSAVADERPVFEAVLASLQPGDTFVVLDLDRAFRSTIDAMLTADALHQRSVKMRVLSLPIDTTTAEGELFYTMVAAFAGFERRIISRRTKEGLEAARRRGKHLGRPPKLTFQQIKTAYQDLATGCTTCREVADALGVSRLTLQRGFHRHGFAYPISKNQKGPTR